MKLVAAICGVQSEQFLEKTLQSLAKTDVDAIHYMDGSWDNTGMNLIQSTDRTQEILAIFKGNHPIEVIYESATNPTYGSWTTQSQKRNKQLYQIERIFGKDTWVLVIDDDEILSPAVPLKPLLQKQSYYLGTMNSVAPPPGERLADLQIMKTARFIKLGNGIHYHTETNMLVHDSVCNRICDYHNERDGFVNEHVFSNDGLLMENLWMLRSPERLEHKNQYYNYLTESNKSIGECKFNE